MTPAIIKGRYGKYEINVDIPDGLKSGETWMEKDDVSGEFITYRLLINGIKPTVEIVEKPV